jgi:hypothetical protein
MGEADKPHLVILVHGIRDIARWQSEVGHTLESEGLIVEHTSYGRLNLFAFLVPIDYFRKKAAARVWTDIQHARMLHPEADVSIIAHSFGTYVVTRILKQEFTLQLKRLLLCGCIVRYDFPFEQIQNRFSPPLLNDVGTSDPWPAFAESVTFGYGAAGTFGFNRPGVDDRYHNGQGHGYFLNKGFAAKYWAPFIKDGTVVPADIEAQQPPLWVRLLSVFKVKWLIVLALLLVIALAVLRGVYGQPAMAVQFGDGNPGFGFWNSSVAPIIEMAGEPCPLPGVLCNNAVGNAITGRRYVATDIVGGNPTAVVSCGAFRFPMEGNSADPVAALEAVAAAYPQCITARTASGWLGLTLYAAAMTEVHPRRQSLPDTMWLCGCTAAQVATFEERF